MQSLVTLGRQGCCDSNERERLEAELLVAAMGDLITVGLRRTAEGVSPRSRLKRRWHAKLDQQGYNDERLADISTVMNALRSCRTGSMSSHFYHCQSCDRRLIGLDHCANRHCPTCGYERREEWREGMIDWSLDCEYFHVVFTLPHTLWPADLCQCQVDVPGLVLHCDSVVVQYLQEGVRLRARHGFDLAYLGTEDESSYPCAYHHDRWWLGGSYYRGEPSALAAGFEVVAVHGQWFTHWQCVRREAFGIWPSTDHVELPTPKPAASADGSLGVERRMASPAARYTIATTTRLVVITDYQLAH